MNRRDFALGGGAIRLWAPGSPGRASNVPLAGLEQRNGGRLGVHALDTGSGRALSHRADERFLMCSTFKLLVVAAVLSRVDAGRENLMRRIRYGKGDLVAPSPATGAHAADGELSVGALCAAAAELSDSTAANLLLKTIGGPKGLTAYLRRVGDATTRVDRYELAANLEHGALDTTSPRSMADTTAKLVLGPVLTPSSRSRLVQWMSNTKPGLARIRAGLPPSWRSGDRTGTNPHRTNDVAVIWPPHRAPVVVAAYYEASAVSPTGREQVLRAVGETVAAWAA